MIRLPANQLIGIRFFDSARFTENCFCAGFIFGKSLPRGRVSSLVLGVFGPGSAGPCPCGPARGLPSAGMWKGGRNILKGYAWFWFSKRSGPAPFKSFQQNHHAQRVADPQHRDDTRRHANDDRVEHILEIASRRLEEIIPE